MTRSPRHTTDSRSHAEVRFGGAPTEKLGDVALTAQVIDRATAATCAEMLDEHDVGFYLKHARVLEAMWGNAADHRERFARLDGY